MPAISTPRSDDGDMYPGGLWSWGGILSPWWNSHSRAGRASRCARSSVSATYAGTEKAIFSGSGT
jgi:hypothetical protein